MRLTVEREGCLWSLEAFRNPWSANITVDFVGAYRGYVAVRAGGAWQVYADAPRAPRHIGEALNVDDAAVLVVEDFLRK